MGFGDKIFGSARDRFGKDVAARIRAFDSVAEADYDPVEFQVVYRRHGADKPAYSYLENTFQECEGASSAERRARIERLASLAGQQPLPETWDEIRPLLRPVLRPAAFGLELAPGIAPISRPAMPYLAELVVVDTPSSMAYLTTKLLATYGATAEQAFATARENLAATALRTMDQEQAAGTPLIRFVDDGDGYVSSLPLVDGWLAGMAVRLGARPIAFVTEQNGLLLTVETADGDAMAALQAMAEEEWRNAVRRVSPVAYTVDEHGRVVPYDVPSGHPAQAALRHARILLALTAYEPQTEHYRDSSGDDDPYIASLKGFRSPAGEESTVAVWTDEIVSLLPKADAIAFPKQGSQMFMLPWDIVAEEVGLTPSEGFYPPRYRVGSWPEPEAIARMKDRIRTP